MKKALALLLACICALSLAACTPKDPDPVIPGGDNNNPEVIEAKLGLGIVPLVSGTNATDASDGAVSVEGVAAAVLLDADGKILDCKLDAVAADVKFSAEGKILNSGDTFPTKGEKKEDYGMSAIGKTEWYIQVEKLEKHLIGKTANEVAGIESGNADVIAAGCTIATTELTEAVVKACNNATVTGAAKGDALALSIVTSAADSKDATPKADGPCSVVSTYAAVAAKDGKVTAAAIDATKITVAVNVGGAITTDIDALELKSICEMGKEYGMSAVTGGKEWNEQAAAFCTYIQGKTASDITGMTLQGGKSTDEALLNAGCTIIVSDFVAAAGKAAEAAK